ncbi:altronate hydrolase [Pedobacter sp. ok626]|uniref:UxaA family hydrolase n=1 Tax=Pedobacter sp. ok626 TaxID=1761882 RepID=UPI0008927C32|nr:altronate dehydratase family protein [Pedobacter sp. ok626]SDL06610.1 altronate hydrolase [Pedobacter sp. ok626]
MERVLKVHPADNVIVALQNLKEGEVVVYDNEEFVLLEDIDAKHKFVTKHLQVGDEVIMYGVLVGKAQQEIKIGQRISTTNLKHDAEDFSVAKRKQLPKWQAPNVDKWINRTFNGYHRSDGKVGTANYWLVIPLVFCENKNILKLRDAFDKALGFGQTEAYENQVADLVASYKVGGLELVKAYQPKEFAAQKGASGTGNLEKLFANVDGIKFLTHEMGCGCTNEDAQRLAALFAAYACNPNVGGITILSLGCQKTRFEDFHEEVKIRNSRFDKPILFFEQQQYGTESAMLSAAIKETFIGLTELNKVKRTPAPLSALTIGLKCGGSDGFSGISANPVLGHLSDLLVALNGKTLLAEFPELCGVEQELINRCEEESAAFKFEHLMRSYVAIAEAQHAGFDMNPSAGNIKDGLITDAIKSAGAAKKGGTAPIKSVLNYTELPKAPGLHLVCTPGNDVLATTGQTASGATIILFTTGLGTPTGNPVCPIVKIATNSILAQKMPDIIDFDCGGIIRGESTIEQKAEELLDYCIKLANGDYLTKSQLLRQDDFIPWQQNVNL